MMCSALLPLSHGWLGQNLPSRGAAASRRRPRKIRAKCGEAIGRPQTHSLGRRNHDFTPSATSNADAASAMSLQSVVLRVKRKRDEDPNEFLGEQRSAHAAHSPPPRSSRFAQHVSPHSPAPPISCPLCLLRQSWRSRPSTSALAWPAPMAQPHSRSRRPSSRACRWPRRNPRLLHPLAGECFGTSQRCPPALQTTLTPYLRCVAHSGTLC